MCCSDRRMQLPDNCSVGRSVHGPADLEESAFMQVRLNVFTLATMRCPGGSMAQTAMLGQGGFGGMHFVNMVRNRESARYGNPNDAFRRGGDIRWPTPCNGARRVERVGLQTWLGSAELWSVEPRGVP